MGALRAPMTVHMLTVGAAPDLAVDATLTLRTVRRGFPNARVCVTDLGSCPPVADQIDALARDARCEVRRPRVPLARYAALNDIVMNPEHSGTHVVLDSRVIFWTTCEHWSFDGLIAGRVVPASFDDGGAVILPRVLPGFWWIPDVERLRERIHRDYRRSAIGHLDAFLPYTCRDRASGTWYRFDEGANLYAALGGEVSPFAEREFDAYDQVSIDGTPVRDLRLVAYGQSDAPGRQEDYTRLRGLWRKQDADLRLRSVPTVLELVLGR